MTCLATFRLLFALLVIPSCVLMVIGIGTSNWLYYNDVSSGVVHVYGLWDVCTEDGGVTTGCVVTEQFGGELGKMVDVVVVRAVLITSATFIMLGIICVYLIVNKWYIVCSALTFALSMFVATVLAWIGLGIFLTGALGSSINENITLDWSLIVTLISGGILVLLCASSFVHACLVYRVKAEQSKEYRRQARQMEKAANDDWEKINYGANVEVGVEEVDAQIYQEIENDNKRCEIASQGQAGVVLKSFKS